MEHENGRGLKILTSKQMLQRLQIALAQVKAGNTSETLLNEICQIIYYLYQTKEITKKVCNNIMESMVIKQNYQNSDTIFMNSANSKTSELHRLLLNLSGEINLKESDKYVALSDLSIHYAWKNIKKSKKINLKYVLRHGIKSFN